MDQTVLSPKSFLAKTAAKIPVVLPEKKWILRILLARLSVRVPLDGVLLVIAGNVLRWNRNCF